MSKRGGCYLAGAGGLRFWVLGAGGTYIPNCTCTYKLPKSSKLVISRLIIGVASTDEPPSIPYY